MINFDVKAAQALAGSEKLKSLLVNGEKSIYHDDAPENDEYPIVMYTCINESPALHADNKLKASEGIIRVTVINNTNVGKDALKNAVFDAMVGAGFMWQMTNSTRDGKECYISLDFSNYG